MKRIWPSLLLLGSAGLLAAATALPSATGQISGTVKARGPNSADAVVYIAPIQGKTFPAPSEKPEIDQKNMLFVPHVLPILVGTTVKFRNSDPVLHNVFTPSPAGDKFNLGSWPQGGTKEYTFKKPGVVTLLCNVHPEMSGYIIVTETPYFAVTDKAGHYVIKDVPPGTYKLVAWHERSKKPVTTTVTVSANGTATADFDLRK